MSYMIEFPDYDDELYIPEGFIDYSWHNDVCPHVAKRYSDKNLEVEVCIWQDYADPELRERDTKRYYFTIEIDNGSIFCCETDDLDKIKELVKCFNDSEWSYIMERR